MTTTIILSDAQAEGLADLLDLAECGQADCHHHADFLGIDLADVTANARRWTAVDVTAEALRTQRSSARGAQHPLFAAAERWADAAAGIGSDGSWTTFNCVEIELLGDVFRAIGRHQLARDVIEHHRADDDEGDDENHPDT